MSQEDKTDGIGLALGIDRVLTGCNLTVCRTLIWVSFVLCLSPVMTSAFCETARGNESKQLVTVADAIQMTRLGRADYFNGPGISSAGLAAQFSPDGNKFVTILRRGDIAKNVNEYSVVLWQAPGILQTPPQKPDVLFTFASSSNREAISDVTWSADNKSILFLGEHPGELRQVYAFNIPTRALSKLTNHSTNVLSYGLSRQSGALAYTAEPAQSAVFDETTIHQGLIVSNELVTDIIVDAKTLHRGVQLFLQTGATEARLITISSEIRPIDKPFVSPDGRFIIIRSLLHDIPSVWQEYDDPRLRQQYALVYILVDVSSGESHTLLPSPIRSLHAAVAWSPDGRSVALGGVYLPLADTTGEQRLTRRSKTFVVEAEVPGGRLTEISREDALNAEAHWYDRRELEWNPTSNRLNYRLSTLDQPSDMTTIFSFLKTNNKWERSSAKSKDAHPEILVDEDMNTAPTLVAVDPTSHRKTQLLDLNPQFRKLRFARVEEVHWKCGNGHESQGGLYYPIDYVSGRRYPLVIQTHNWNSKKFWIDGPYTTAFAAQPLAAKNIMVLQLDEVQNDMPDPTEMEREIATYEGAIDSLEQKGLIDTNRVGLVGFSRTCLSVKYALTHSRYHFAAASITDGLDGGYVQFISRFGLGKYLIDFETALNGGLPWGAEIKSWILRTPGFNLAGVETPIRIMALNKAYSLLGEWEWFAGLTLLDKPVELVVLPDAVHVLQRPSDRMVSQQGNVDWFSFWLNGEEDPDPAKSEQYARWRKLRDERKSDLKVDRKPV